MEKREKCKCYNLEIPTGLLRLPFEDILENLKKAKDSAGGTVEQFGC